MKITLLGGGGILVNTLKSIVSNKEIKIIDVITSPRHAEDKYDENLNFEDITKKIIEEKNNSIEVNFFIIDNLDNSVFKNSVKESNLQLSISAAWIYKKRHIEICSNLVQLHCTSLPEWRGGGNTSWRILSGINHSAFVLFYVDEGVDTGDILFYEKFFFPPSCKKPIDYEVYNNKIAEKNILIFLNEFIKNKSLPIAKPQQEEFSSYFPRLNTKIHGCINWDWEPEDIVKFISAFDDPYDGAFSRLTNHNSKVYLKGATYYPSTYSFHPFQAGIIYKKDKFGIYICTRGGSILVSKVLGINNECFFEKIVLGERFYNTKEDLTKALSTRIKYSPKN